MGKLTIMRLRKIKEELKMIILRIKEKLTPICLGMKRRQKTSSKTIQSESPSRSKLKKEKERVIMRFLYSNGMLKRIRVVSVEEAKELEYWWKQKQEIQVIENSKARQRYRIQQLIAFSVILDSMCKQQISHVGHRRYIPEKEFMFLMREASVILEELIKKCSAPKSLRDISKEKVFLHQIPYASICLETLQNKDFSFIKFDLLPKTLQKEISELSVDISDQEAVSLNLINSCLISVSDLYNKAFSCNSSNICQEFCFYVQ